MEPGVIPDVGPDRGRCAPVEDAAELLGVKELLAQARDASADGRPEDALALSQRILEEDPENPEAFLLAAFAHADTGDLDSARPRGQPGTGDRSADRGRTLHPRHHLSAYGRSHAGALGVQEDDLHRCRLPACPSQPCEPVSSPRARPTMRAGNTRTRSRRLYRSPEGEWTAFLGGFKPDLLAKTCERSLIECRKTT